jgi:hypothetical protein
LSADGNSIAGGLLQNGTTLTLNLVRATAQTRRQRGRFPGPPARDILVAGGAQEEFNPGQCKMPNGAKPSFGTPVVCRKLGFWPSPVLAPQIDDFLLRGCCTRRHARRRVDSPPILSEIFGKNCFQRRWCAAIPIATGVLPAWNGE